MGNKNLNKWPKDATRIAIWGASKSGKSTLAKNKLKLDGGPIVVFDPMDEYEAEGMKRFSSIPELAKFVIQQILVMGSGVRFLAACYVPKPGHEAKELHLLCKMLFKVQEPYRAWKHPVKVTLVVEEMNLSYPVHSLPVELDGFANVCSRGRHYGINVLGISQRPNEVNKRFRGNTDETYVLRLADRQDQQAIVQSVGVEYGPKLLKMEPHQWLHIVNGHVTEGKNQLN